METAWLKQFSDTTESFENNNNNNNNNKKESSTNDFLTTFLKSNPLKSVYTEPPSDTRNVEPLETIGGSGFDNVKGLQEEEAEKKREQREKIKEEKAEDKAAIQNDKEVIGDMFTTAATSLLSLYLAYNLYFNLTAGDKKIVEIEKTLDSIPMKPATNWFVEIVKNINSFITTSIPTRLKSVIDGNPYFKYRTVFVLFVVLANFILKPAVNSIIQFFEGLSKQKSKNVLKYIFNYQNNNKIISVLFFFFLTKSLYTMFLEESAGPIVSFIVANPILFLIGLFVYVVVLYPITVPLSTFAVTCLFIFYGFFSMIYFYNTESFDAKSPYANVSSFFELFSAMNHHMNFGPVLFENQNNAIEKALAFVFNDIHYLYFFGILAGAIPFLLRMKSSVMQTYFFVTVGALMALCGAFKVYGVSGLFNTISRKTI
jgi:hypothetical protein